MKTVLRLIARRKKKLVPRTQSDEYPRPTGRTPRTPQTLRREPMQGHPKPSNLVPHVGRDRRRGARLQWRRNNIENAVEHYPKVVLTRLTLLCVCVASIPHYMWY